MVFVGLGCTATGTALMQIDRWLGFGVGEFDDGDFATGAADFNPAHIGTHLENFDGGLAGVSHILTGLDVSTFQ